MIMNPHKNKIKKKKKNVDMSHIFFCPYMQVSMPKYRFIKCIL